MMHLPYFRVISAWSGSEENETLRILLHPCMVVHGKRYNMPVEIHYLCMVGNKCV